MAIVTEHKERPILYRDELVRAILEGVKTETRRPCAVQPQEASADGSWARWRDASADLWRNKEQYARDCCPHGNVGDRLWVRETFLYRENKAAAIYRSDLDSVEAAGIAGMYGGWKPSIHMPRRLSRIKLEILGLGLERVQSISLESILAEGVKILVTGTGELIARLSGPYVPSTYWPCKTYKELWARPDFEFQWFRCHFASSWDSIYGKTKHSWNANPFVWVIRFKKV